MKDLAKELFAALLRKPDYGATSAQPSRWRVMSAADVGENTPHEVCDDACECAAPSRLKYQPKD
jgi:hypothetical protein